MEPCASAARILLSVWSMLAEPNVDTSKVKRDDQEQFYKITKQIVQKSLGL